MKLEEIIYEDYWDSDKTGQNFIPANRDYVITTLYRSVSQLIGFYMIETLFNKLIAVFMLRFLKCVIYFK